MYGCLHSHLLALISISGSDIFEDRNFFSSISKACLIYKDFIILCWVDQGMDSNWTY